MDDWKGIRLIPLGENEPLRSGDRVLIRFKWLINGTWLRAYQWNVIEKKLEGRSDWRVISYRNEGDFLDAEIEVLSAPQAMAMDPGSGITQAGLVVLPYLTVIAISAAVAATAYALQTIIYYRLVAEGKIEPSVSAVAEVSQGLHVLAYVAGGVVALLILKTVLRR
jgi:hypothetical protein